MPHRCRCPHYHWKARFSLLPFLTLAPRPNPLLLPLSRPRFDRSLSVSSRTGLIVSAAYCCVEGAHCLMQCGVAGMQLAGLQAGKRGWDRKGEGRQSCHGRDLTRGAGAPATSCGGCPPLFEGQRARHGWGPARFARSALRSRGQASRECGCLGEAGQPSQPGAVLASEGRLGAAVRRSCPSLPSSSSCPSSR